MQAGTGTGKTLAYLLPAIASGARVVVATATKALQDQLAGKDLPFLARRSTTSSTGPCSRAAATTSACNGCARCTTTPPASSSWRGSRRRARSEIARIATWVATTDTGDGAELDWSPSDAVWRMVSVGSDECPGADRCPLGEPCFAEQARRRAGVADVVVVNTHLYGLHVGSGGVLLPEHDVVVFDEAHVLEDVMSDTVGVQLAPGRFVTMAGTLRRILDDPDLVASVIDIADLLREALGPHAGRRLPVPYPDDVHDAIVEARTPARPGERGARRHRDAGRRRQAAQAARPARSPGGPSSTSTSPSPSTTASSTTCPARPSCRASRSPRSTSGRRCARASGTGARPS